MICPRWVETETQPVAKINPGETRAVILSGLLDAPGRHVLTATVSTDDLPADDRFDQVIRVTAPMHDGFSGGLCLDAAGQALGLVTAARIRGFRVVIPAAIAWKAAQDVLEHGRPRRGYLGVAGQAVQLAAGQRPAADRETAVLIVGVTPDSPAASAGLIVGDVLTDFDGQPIESPEDLLDVLVGDRVGRQVELRILRGGKPETLSVTVGEK